MGPRHEPADALCTGVGDRPLASRPPYGLPLLGNSLGGIIGGGSFCTTMGLTEGKNLNWEGVKGINNKI